MSKRYLKLSTICMMAAMLYALLFCTEVKAANETYGNYTISVNDDGTAEIISFSKSYEGELVIPGEFEGKKVVAIGNSSFSNCTSLTSVTIPSSVKTIAAYAFDGCTSLAEVSVPRTVVDVQSMAFYGTPWLESITDENGFAVVNNIFLRYSGEETVVHIPEGIRTIGGNAMTGGVYVSDNSDVEKIVLPESVTYISDNAFSGCPKLKEINLPDGIYHLGDAAFSNCKSLTSIVIPSLVKEIGQYTFSYCEALSSVSMPEGLTSIGFSAFASCKSLTNLNLPKSVTQIDGLAFDGTPWLESIKNSAGYAIANGILCKYYGNEDIITLPSSVEVIAGYAFANCNSVTYITLPNSVKVIGPQAFYRCTNLKRIDIPNSVTTIGRAAFSNLQCLWTLILPDSVTTIEDNAFYYSGLREVVLPSKLTYIPDGAFTGCADLDSIALPNTLTSIGDEAFKNCTSLNKVSLPANIKSIGHNAYYGCTSLDEVTIPNGVDTIGNYAFYRCSALKSVTIPGSVKRVGDYAFYLCEGLTQAVMQNGVKEIGRYAFSDCTAMTNVVVPESIQYIGGSAFADVPWFERLRDGDGFIRIHNILCDYNGSAAELTLPSGITAVGEKVFYDCTFEKVTVPEGVTDLYSFAFTSCSNMKQIYLPSTLKNVHPTAFRYSDALTDIYYNGTKEQWNAVNIAAYNDTIYEVTVHCLDGDIHVHSYAEEVTDPTCTQQGYTTFTCDCGESYNGAYTEPLGHDWGRGYVVTEATMDTEGLMYYECYCGESKTEVIPKLSEQPVTNPFYDIEPDDYYYAPVLWALDEKITSGLTASSFAPGDSCTRGQVVTFLWRAFNEPEPKTASTAFADVPDGKYYSKAVRWAVENGITSGLTAVKFGPEETVTRAQFITFLYRAEKTPAYTTANPFVDVPNSYYTDAVLWGYENKVVNGLTAVTFGPEDFCTRGQVVTFLYRAYNTK